MLDGGSFFATALALVGFAPAREPNRREPNLALIPDVPVIRPTMTESPYRELALMPVDTKQPQTNAIEREVRTIKRERTRCPLPPAETAAFIDWLREINEFGELTRRRLLSLYAEFCDNAFAPVTSRRLLLQISACGVVKRRLSATKVNGKYHSPTVYRVLPTQIARAPE